MSPRSIFKIRTTAMSGCAASPSTIILSTVSTDRSCTTAVVMSWSASKFMYAEPKELCRVPQNLAIAQKCEVIPEPSADVKLLILKDLSFFGIWRARCPTHCTNPYGDKGDEGSAPRPPRPPLKEETLFDHDEQRST